MLTPSLRTAGASVARNALRTPVAAIPRRTMASLVDEKRVSKSSGVEVEWRLTSSFPQNSVVRVIVCQLELAADARQIHRDPHSW